MDDPISGLKKGLSSGSGDEWESDEEDGKNSQYQLLPQDPPIESEGTANVNSTNSDEDIEQVRSKDAVKPLDKSPIASPSMDEGHADVVVKAMAGFSLSPSSIPEWAKVVPEEVWKNELLAGLKPKKSRR